MDRRPKSNFELVTTDIFVLNDHDLRLHINDLQNERNQLKTTVVPNVAECNVLIGLAHSELSSRATDRLAKRAIYISVLAIVISCGAPVMEVVFG
jgi:hypothetical protein